MHEMALRVSRDPSNICHTRVFVVGVEIEYVFDSQGRAKQVTAGGVNNTLWLACRSGCLVVDRTCQHG
jgi:hypothetical protein